MNALLHTRIRLLLVAAAMLCSAGAMAQNVLIRGAEVHTPSGKLDNANVLVRGGRIEAVGAGLAAPSGITVIEAKGRPLTAGLFAGFSDIGIDEVSLEKSTTDSGLSVGADKLRDAQWRPEFDVTLAYNPNSVLLPVARIEGFTWTVLEPYSVAGGSFVAGQGAAVLFDSSYDAVISGSQSLFVNMGGDAMSFSGGSRSAQYMLLEQAIREARASSPPTSQSLLHPAGREALAKYLAGGRVVLHVERAADIRRAVAFVRAAGMKPIVAGGAEAWMVADELARNDIPVLLDPLENLPSNFDGIGARLDNAAILHRAGVRVGFSGAGSSNARKVRQHAGSAVAHGLPWNVALAGLTSLPADLFGIAASRGRIAVGQSADLVLWSGDPLEITSIADQVWIAGKAIEMRSRQTELRDRHLERLKRGMAR
jgi:imidazolonepropionase-like amidohydrolase